MPNRMWMGPGIFRISRPGVEVTTAGTDDLAFWEGMGTPRPLVSALVYVASTSSNSGYTAAANMPSPAGVRRMVGVWQVSPPGRARWKLNHELTQILIAGANATYRYTVWEAST